MTRWHWELSKTVKEHPEFNWGILNTHYDISGYFVGREITMNESDIWLNGRATYNRYVMILLSKEEWCQPGVHMNRIKL